MVERKAAQQVLKCVIPVVPNQLRFGELSVGSARRPSLEIDAVRSRGAGLTAPALATKFLIVREMKGDKL